MTTAPGDGPQHTASTRGPDTAPTAHPDSPTVRTEVLGPVLVVTIDRPHVRNAVDGPTAAALAEAFRDFEADDDRSVAVLTGAGGTFCSGADLTAISEGRGNRVDADVTLDGPMGPTRMFLSKPVIAAVEGHAVAGGLELALWCDLRVAATDATFGVYCRRWGVPLVDGGTVRLPRLIGHSAALDLILTGRGVAGEEALRLGLANRLVEPGQALTAAVELAEQLAALPQRCLRSDRRSASEQWDLPLDAALAREVALGLDVIASGETREGATRFARGAGRHGSSAAVRPDDPSPSPSASARADDTGVASSLDLAARIFAAIEAGDVDTVAELWDDGIAVWHNTDGIEQTKAENLRTLAWMARTTTSRSYRDVRRHETPTGFAQQHVLHLAFPDGRVAELPAAIFVEVHDARVTRIDEYLDTAAVAAAFDPPTPR